MNKEQHYQLTRIFFPFLVTFLFFSVSGEVFAAFSQGGSIRGKVVADIPQQRRVLPGVVVSLSSERLKEKKTEVVSDAEGQFGFQSLVAGDYVVTVDFAGFKKYEQRLSVQIGATV